MPSLYDRPAGEQPNQPVRISESQHLTGQCPQCGWTPVPQNVFRPNVFHEYVNEKGVMAILSESEDTVQSKDSDGNVLRIWLRLRDDSGQVIRREKAPFPQQQLQQKLETITIQTPSGPQGILPSKPLPPSLLKTPDEQAKSPKPTIAPVEDVKPVLNNPPADLPPQPNKAI